MDMPLYNQSPTPPRPKPFLDNFPPKTAFIGGFVAAILILGTAGFIILGSCVLKGGCSALPGQAAEKQPVAAGNPNSAPETELAGIPVVSEDDYILGAEEAPITIIEYSDIECPFCARFHPLSNQAIAEYPGQVRWVFRHFPLSFHAQAEPAANAAECAGEQGKFYEFIDILYEKQDSLSLDLYKNTARSLGLKTAQFNDCLESGKYVSKIRSQAQGGAEAGVEGTPGSFVIGPDGSAVPIRGALPWESVKQVIESFLQ